MDGVRPVRITAPVDVAVQLDMAEQQARCTQGRAGVAGRAGASRHLGAGPSPSIPGKDQADAPGAERRRGALTCRPGLRPHWPSPRGKTCVPHTVRRTGSPVCSAPTAPTAIGSCPARVPPSQREPNGPDCPPQQDPGAPHRKVTPRGDRRAHSVTAATSSPRI